MSIIHCNSFSVTILQKTLPPLRPFCSIVKLFALKREHHMGHSVGWKKKPVNAYNGRNTFFSNVHANIAKCVNTAVLLFLTHCHNF